MAQLAVDRQRLIDFLEEHGKNKRLLNEAKERLELFFQRAAEGKYPLAPASEALGGEAAAALQALFGQEKVKRAILVSLLPAPIQTRLDEPRGL